MKTARTAKQSMSVKEIAAAIRADIKDAVKAGQLPAFKVSVRKEDHNSIRVVVTEVPSGYLIPNIDHVQWVDVNGEFRPYRERLNDTARAHLEILESIVSEYHWDESDTMTDYFHCNFYKHVDFGGCETEQRKAIAASLKAPEACKVVRVVKRAAPAQEPAKVPAAEPTLAERNSAFAARLETLATSDAERGMLRGVCKKATEWGQEVSIDYLRMCVRAVNVARPGMGADALAELLSRVDERARKPRLRLVK